MQRPTASKPAPKSALAESEPHTHTLRDQNKLINRVRRAIVMSEGRQISARDLELGEYVEVAPVSLAQAREAAERQAIELALLRHRGRLGDAAQELGISRVTLYRLLSAHGMRHIEVDAPTEHVTRG